MMTEEYLAKTQITQGLFLILVGRAQAPVWDMSVSHHIKPKSDALCLGQVREIVSHEKLVAFAHITQFPSEPLGELDRERIANRFPPAVNEPFGQVYPGGSELNSANRS